MFINFNFKPPTQIAMARRENMISKEEFTGALVRELEVIKHLGSKVKPEQLSFKPTEKQRTTQELMHYLSYVFVALAESIYKGDKSIYMSHMNEKESVSIENFAGSIDSQIAKIQEYVNMMNEEDMKVEVDIWVVQTKAMHLLHMLKTACAYKMQLFLYLKQSGSPELNTSNLWRGVDAEMKE